MMIKIEGRLWDFKNKCAKPKGEYEVMYHNILFRNLQIFLKRQKKEWDVWGIYSGDEGDGKSTRAKQDCYYMAYKNGHEFTADHIAFRPKEFAELIDKAKKGYSVLFDEAITGLSSQRTMSQVNHVLRVKAALCRKKQLFVAICMPSFFDLDKNIAIHRTRFLLSIYEEKLVRGKFAYFTKGQKKRLYLLGKKFYDMSRVKPEFRGNFPKWSFIDEAEYEKRKDKASELIDFGEDTSKFKEHRNSLIYSLYKNGTKVTDILNHLNKYVDAPIGARAIYKSINQMKKLTGDEKNNSEVVENGNRKSD